MKEDYSKFSYQLLPQSAEVLLPVDIEGTPGYGNPFSINRKKTTRRPLLSEVSLLVLFVCFVLASVFFFVFVFLPFVCIHRRSDFMSASVFPHGSKIQIFSPSHNLFLRRNSSASQFYGGSALILDKPFPWLHGSTFEIHRDFSVLGLFSIESRECFQLKSMINTWVGVDYNNHGRLIADGSSKKEGHWFSLHPVNDQLYNGNQNEVNSFLLKTCHETDYFTVVSDPLNNSSSANATYIIQLSEESSRGSFPFSYFRKLHRSFSSSTTSVSFQSKVTHFKVNYYQPLIGVNLGGWFLPEVWMNPSFFNESHLGWGASLCRCDKTVLSLLSF
jgi:hypothetical protein